MWFRRADPLIERLLEHRRRHLVVVDQPMVLISQPTRSGGTLLSQLFDAHPQLHAHPYELEFGHPRPSVWPDLNPRKPPEKWFKRLRETHVHRAFEAGYEKNRPALRLGFDDQFERFPFILPPELQRALFFELVAERQITSSREVINCYLTSYFNAWLDNQNLYGPDKRWVVAFRSNLGLGKTSKPRAFFADYPDGRLISIVRDPVAWTASKMVYARTEDADREEFVERSLGQWTATGAARLDAREGFGDRVFLLEFERLVTETDPVMRVLSAWLGIDFLPVLTVPTFNGLLIKANSSYRVPGHGVISQPLDNWRTVLTDAEAQRIRAGTEDLHRELQAACDERL